VAKFALLDSVQMEPVPVLLVKHYVLASVLIQTLILRTAVHAASNASQESVKVASALTQPVQVLYVTVLRAAAQVAFVLRLLVTMASAVRTYPVHLSQIATLTQTVPLELFVQLAHAVAETFA